MAIVRQSRFGYSETVARLSEAIAAAGSSVFATIDQAAAAAGAGLSLRPTTLLVFGNPKAGTPLMDAFPLAALELPLKLLVWQDGEHVYVAYGPMSEVAIRYGITGKDALIAAMDTALDALCDAVAV